MYMMIFLELILEKRSIIIRHVQRDPSIPYKTYNSGVPILKI